MSAAAPRVSVLLPVFDAEATLAAALRSVARQTLEDLECIVVDDGSRDASAEIAQAFTERDPRFRLVRRSHRGIVASLQDGLEHCRAPLVARMDADDLMHRRRLRLQVEALDRRTQLAGVGCRVRLFPRRPMTDGLRHYERWLNAVETPEDVAREAFVECPIAHPTLTLRREILARCAWRESTWPEDYDLVLRLLAGGEHLAVLPRRLHAWRDDPQRLSRTDPRYATARFTDCKAAFLAEGFLAAHPEYVLWGYGDTGRALRRALLVHERAPSHIVELHPGRLGQRIHGAPVIAPEGLAELAGRPVVASVAGAEARGLIRKALAALGREEGRDFVVAA